MRFSTVAALVLPLATPIAAQYQIWDIVRHFWSREHADSVLTWVPALLAYSGRRHGTGPLC